MPNSKPVGPVGLGRDPGEFANIFKTNVVGPYLVTRALLPLIKKGRKKQVRKLMSPCVMDNMLKEVCTPRPFSYALRHCRVKDPRLGLRTYLLAQCMLVLLSCLAECCMSAQVFRDLKWMLS